MKVFVVLVSLSVMILIRAHDVNKDQHDHGHGQSQGHVVLNVDKHVVQAGSAVPNNEVLTETAIAGQNVEHQSQHQLKPDVQVQHANTEHPKVTVQIPSNVQHIVTQVSQHVPAVIGQHIAKERVQRSVWRYVPQLVMEKPRKCDYKCDVSDLPVCGYNGRCHRQFDSNCELSAFNCLNANKLFHRVEDVMCQDPDTTKCYPGDE